MNLICTFLLALGLTFTFTDLSISKHLPQTDKFSIESKTTLPIDTTVVYQTEHLIVKKITDHIYVHVSYLNTDDFGKVGCNGMLVFNNGEGVIFDSPTDNQSAEELIKFVTHTLKGEITAIIPTHFHDDCVGGIEKFEAQNIPTYATKRTIEFLKKNGQKFSQPVHSFDDHLTLKIGTLEVRAEYFGQGHTKDNIVGYVPSDNVIFGGCLIKEIGAGKGFLGDANIEQWPTTVEKLKSKYPEVKIVIPGHGQLGGIGLLDYTIKLFGGKS